MKTLANVRVWALILGLLLVLSALPVAAQQAGAGQIEGVVTDQTGAVIPGARVVVHNVATGVDRELTTNSMGRYRAVSLPPGNYEVTVEHGGFATLKRSGIRLEVGDTATVNITLEVAKTTEVVTVTEAAPIAEPDKTSFTATVPQVQVENLPINGRRWDNFMLLTPTTSPDGNFGLISVRGISGLYNNNTVDGADNNQAFFSEARGRTRAVYTLSQAAIREFQVGISNYSAEFGRSVGGTINAVTKSGGNTFHGEGFYYISDDVLDAQDPFDHANGLTKLPERRQQFGFSMGGPIVKDKLFWFLNYDQQVKNFPGVTAQNSTSDLNDPAQTPCTIALVPGRCDAARALLLSELGVFPRKGHNNVSLGKLDWIISPRNTLTGQYNYSQWRSPNGIYTQHTQSVTQGSNGFDGVRTDFLLLHLTTLASSSTVNDFRFQYGRDFEFQRGNEPGPWIHMTGNVGIDDGLNRFLPRTAFPNEKRFQFTDNLSWVHGRHLVKAGFDINYVRDQEINLFQGGGEYDYSSFQNFARDVPLPGLPIDPDTTGGSIPGQHYSNYYQAFDTVTQGISDIRFNTTDWNFFVEDSWKLRPTLTLNLGMRYEYTSTPQPDQSIYSCVGAGTCPAFAALPTALQAAAQHLNKDTNNFGPRVAMAWDVLGNQKAILRLGYGMYYGRTSNSALAAGLFEGNSITRFTIRERPGDATAPTFPDTFCSPPLGTPGSDSVCTPPIGGSVSMNVFSPDYVRPLIHSGELTAEFALSPNMSLSASYLVTRGLRLPAFIDTNISPSTDIVTLVDGSTGTTIGQIPFFQGPRPYSGYGSIIFSPSTVNSWYNGFVLRVRRRMSAGLQFDSHFTWAHATDDGQSSTTFFAFFGQRVNPFDVNNEHGNSSFDIRKRWVSSFVWDPPFAKIQNDGVRKALDGFEFSGVLTVRDGHAEDGTVSMDFINPFSLFLGWNAVSTFTANGSGGDSRIPFLGRNSFTTSGLVNADFRVTREIRLNERMKAVFLWEAFNIFNHANFFDFFNSAYFGAVSCTQPAFGVCDPGSRVVTFTPRSGFLTPSTAASTLYAQRKMQFGFKFIW